ncbi:MAG: calcium-binding protein [Pseudomonadota bacterium]
MSGGAGDDQVSGSDGRDDLSGGAGDDTVTGGRGADVLSGDGGNDQLDGGQGADTLDGGAGQDMLTGGSNADTFVFGRGDGADLVTDFVEGADVLDLSDHGFASFAALTGAASATARADETLFEFGAGDSVLVQGLSFASLDASDVLI